MVCIGALHCLDAGVTADIIGNILWEAVLWLGLPGRTQKLRVIPLWRMMQQFYKDNSVKGGLQGLTILMIKQQGKSPKIRCKAAQARHLIGFASLVAQQLHDRWQSDHTRLVLQVATCLEQLQLVMDKAWDPEVARALSVQVATGFVKLNQEALGELKLGAKLQRWRVKPKLHMMQELLEYQAFSLGNPRGFWEYLDEDFVGIISTLALKKGWSQHPLGLQHQCDFKVQGSLVHGSGLTCANLSRWMFGLVQISASLSHHQKEMHQAGMVACQKKAFATTHGTICW
jgi:hypothetical protein